jgi:hypothetical protein
LSICKNCGVENFSNEVDCVNCGARTRRVNSKVWSFLPALVGLSTTVVFWAALFALSSLILVIAQDYVPGASYLSDELSPFSATSTLLVGLGGTAVISTSGIGATSTAMALVLIGWLYYLSLKFASAKFVTPKFGNTASVATSAGLGSAFVIGLLGVLSSGSQNIGGANIHYSMVWVVPVCVSFILTFATIADASAYSITRSIKAFLAPIISGYKGSLGLVVFISWLAFDYLALRMGTTLIPTWEIWQWAVLLLAWALVVPTLNLMLIPLWFSVPFVVASPVVYYFNSFDSNPTLSWVKWVALGVALLSVVISAIKAGVSNESNKNYWWQFATLGLFGGLVYGWLSSIRVSGQLTTYTYGLLSSLTGPNVVWTAVLFAVFGLLVGWALHPSMVESMQTLEKVLVKPVFSVLHFIKAIYTFQWVPGVKNLKAFGSKQPHLVKRVFRRAVAVLVILGFFAVGQPFAYVTRPFYDNQFFAEPIIEKALQTGDTKVISKLLSANAGYDAALPSTGVGATTKFTVENLADDEHRKLSWAKGKYSVSVAAYRSVTKAPYLTVVPQWDAEITTATLPTLKIQSGKHDLKYIDIKGVAYKVDRTLLIPGGAKVRAGLDDKGYLKSSTVKVVIGKSKVAKVILSLDDKKGKVIHAAILSDESPKSGCSPFTMNASKPAKLGAWKGTDLPTIVEKGRGKCTQDDYYTGEKTTFAYGYTATGTFHFNTGKWTWKYAFTG